MQGRKEWLGGFKEGTLRHRGTQAEPALSCLCPAFLFLCGSLSLTLPLSPPPSPPPAEALIVLVTHWDAPRIPSEPIPARLSPQKDQVGDRLGCL